MNCKTVGENLCAYIDDELNANEKLSFEEHVKNCGTCKNELEEMVRVVDLCKSLPQQELPDDFKTELHEKLVAASNRQDQKAVGIRKTKFFFTARMFASIAAGILLIFLVGIIYNVGFITPNATQSTTRNMSAAADQAKTVESKNTKNGTEAAAPKLASDEKMESVAAAEGTKPANSAAVAAAGGIVSGMTASVSGTAAAGKKASNKDGGSKNSGDVSSVMITGKNSADGDSAANSSASLTVSGRASDQDVRDSNITGSAQELKMETVSNRFSTISVFLDDPVLQQEKIKSLALENNGENIAEHAFSFSVPASTSGAAIKSEAASQKLMTANSTDAAISGEQPQSELRFLIPVSQYSQFASGLNSALGTTNVRISSIVTEDATSILNSDIQKSNQLDSRIQKLESSDSNKNAGEIEQLKTEKDDVDERINKLRLETDYVQITILINKK